MQRLADELGVACRAHRLPGVVYDTCRARLAVSVGWVRVEVGIDGVLRPVIPRDEVDWLRLATVLRDLAIAVERAFAEPHPTRKGD